MQVIQFIFLLSVPLTSLFGRSLSSETYEVEESQVSITLEEGVEDSYKGNYTVDLFLGFEASKNQSREEKISFYTALNQQKVGYLHTLDLNCFEITHFWTMPIISLHYSNTEIIELKKELQALSRDTNLSLKTINIALGEERPLNGVSLQKPDPREEPLNDRGPELPPENPWIDYRDIPYDNYSSTTYNGLGVKIGVAENDTIYTAHTNFLGSPITKHGSQIVGSYPDADSHAAKVMSVLTGKYGIAPMASTHILNGNENIYKAYHYLDYFNTWGMDVVNLSVGSTGTSNDAYFDYAVSNYGLTIVGACTNSLTGNLNQPGSAQNVIAACSVSPNYSIATGSNNRINDVVENFRIAAVGQTCIVNVYGTNTALSGTSFAAPAVTGTIALMMQKNPALKGHPERVMAALGLAANRTAVSHNSNANVLDVLDTTSGNWSWSGVGALDITRSLETASLINPTNWNFSVNNTYTMETMYGVQAGQTIRITHAWLRTGIETAPYTFSDYPLSNFDLKLYDPQNNICASTTKGSTNTESIEFSALLSGTYTIKTTVCSLVGSQYHLACRKI